MALGVRSFYKKTERVTFDGTVAGLLDCFIDSGNAVATALAADGWGIEVDGTAGVSLTPPNAPNSRIVLAGVDAGAPTPTMMSELSDTFTTGILLAGTVHAVSGGTFDWDAASAGYSGGSEDFSGYLRALAPVNSTRLVVAYNDYGLKVTLDAGANSTLKPLFIGGLIIPYDPDVVEEDGRQWIIACAGGVATTGLSANNAWSGTSGTTTNANAYFAHGNANGNAHCMVRLPSTGVWYNASKVAVQNPAVDSHSSLDGYISPLPLLIEYNSGQLTADALGYLEGIFMPSNDIHLTVFRGNRISDDVQVDAGFVISGGFTSAQNAMYFEMSDNAALKPAAPATS